MQAYGEREDRGGHPDDIGTLVRSTDTSSRRPSSVEDGLLS